MPALHLQRRRVRLRRAPVLAILIGALGASAACGGAGGDDEVRALVDKEVRAINGEDLKALGEIWSQSDDITMFDVPLPGRFQGWNGIARQWKEFFDRVSEIDLKVDALRVVADGDFAYATYDWTIGGRLGDHLLRDRGQATAVYRREDAGWRLAHAHYSPLVAAPPEDRAADAAPAPSPSSTPAPGPTP